MVSDVRKGITKCRIMTERLQHKFSISPVSVTCKCCSSNDEDVPHMILEYLTLLNQRKSFYPRIMDLNINNSCIVKWKEMFNIRERVRQLFLGCSSFPEIQVKSMQRSGTEAIRIQIQLSKPKREINNITNSQNTKKEGISVQTQNIDCGYSLEPPHSDLSKHR